jgi:hypothetical protein
VDSFDGCNLVLPQISQKNLLVLAGINPEYPGESKEKQKDQARRIRF